MASDLFSIDNITISIDVKEITEAGFGTSSATTNVTVPVTKNFATLTAVTVTPKPSSSARYYVGVVFDESRPQPRSFQVFILDSNGNRAAVPFSWIVRGVQGGGQLPWTPANISSGLVHWYDAQYPESLTITSGAISQWNNRASNSYHLTQANSGFRPVITETGINGLGAVRYDGTDDTMVNTDVSVVPKTAYAVARTDSVNGWRRILSMGSTSYDQVAFVGLGTQNNPYFTTLFGPGTVWNDLNANTPLQTFSGAAIVGFTNDGTTATPYYNGTAQNTKTGTTTTATFLAVGGIAGQFWQGDIGELLICSSALDTATRQKLEGYLAWRWKLEGSLPSGHPYKTTIPTV